MRRIAVHVSEDLYEAVGRTCSIERRSRSALCAAIIEDVLTDGGSIALEDVGVPDRGSDEHADSRKPHAARSSTSPERVRGSGGVVSRYFDRDRGE